MDKIKNIINKFKIEDIYLYLLIFFVFMGTNFCKFKIFDVNFNITRILMISTIVPIIIGIIKTKSIRKYLMFENKTIRYSIYFFLVWVVYSIFTILWNKDFNSFVIGNFYTISGTFVILYLIKSIKNNNQIVNILKIIKYTVTVNCIYYMYLYLVKGLYLGGFFHNINDLATVILFCIPITVYFIIREKKIYLKIINTALFLILSISFYLINSRACILGLILSLLSAGILFIVKNKEKIFAKRMTTIIILISVALFVIIASNVIYKNVKGISLKPYEIAKNSSQVRINLIYNAVEFLKYDFNFIKGVGVGNVIYYYQNYSIYSLHNIYVPHNFWLQILLEYGIVIFIGFLTMYYLVCRYLFKRIVNKRSFKVDISIVFFFFLIALIIACISSSTLLTREWIWTIFAIILSYINIDKGESLE